MFFYCLPILLYIIQSLKVLWLLTKLMIMFFFTAAVAALGKEQFVGMYLSAGVVSSFTSFLYKVVANQPGLSLGAVS